MTGPRSASPLVSSSADWTGADIGGLHDLAATLHGYLPGIAGVAAALNQEVARWPAATRAGAGRSPRPSPRAGSATPSRWKCSPRW
jgi:hypothetical protein